MNFATNLTEELLIEHVKTCRDCGTLRTELSYEELPLALKTEFRPHLKAIDYCLYCPDCNEYSWISKEKENRN